MADPNKLLFHCCGADIDTTDFMRKCVYDKDNDGVVDKINKLTDVAELATGKYEGAIPKSTLTGTEWDDDNSANVDIINGGKI
jgi:hypothetical protein